MTALGAHRAPLQLESSEPARAVALLVLVDAVHIQDAQQKIAGRHRLPVEMNVASAFQLSIDAAD